MEREDRRGHEFRQVTRQGNDLCMCGAQKATCTSHRDEERLHQLPGIAAGKKNFLNIPHSLAMHSLSLSPSPPPPSAFLHLSLPLRLALAIPPLACPPLPFLPLFPLFRERTGSRSRLLLARVVSRQIKNG